MANETLSIRASGDVQIIDVNSDLGRYAADDLRKALNELLGQNNRKIVVNLSTVQHINSTSIGTFVTVAKELRNKNGDLKVYGLADNVKRAFDLVGASQIVEIYESESDALATS